MRLKLSPGMNTADLRARLAESFYPSDVGNKLRLKYKDDTEEWCTLGATPTWTSVGRSTVKPEPSDSAH